MRLSYLALTLSLAFSALAKDQKAKSEDIEALKSQVNEMLEELRHQNRAIFKQADAAKTVEAKVAKLAQEVAQIREKAEIAEFRVSKKMKKMKARLANVDTRMDVCRCPQLRLGHIVEDEKKSKRSRGRGHKPRRARKSQKGQVRKPQGPPAPKSVQEKEKPRKTVQSWGAPDLYDDHWKMQGNVPTNDFLRTYL